MQIAGYEVSLVEAGNFWLDGGGMFGVVPWAMWHSRVQADPQNRVQLSTTCLLLEGGGRKMLVETGYGDKMGPKERTIYGIGAGGIAAALAGRGIEPADVTDIICTHLHFDHAGGLTRIGADGRAVPTFPNARLFVQRRELDDALANRSHMRTTYRQENIEPLRAAGLVTPLDGEAEIAPAVRVIPAGGHTLGHQAVIVGGRMGPTLCFIGDLVPTRNHLRRYWTTGYDIQPATVNETRDRLIGLAVAGGWIVVFPHDPRTPAVRVGVDEDGRWASESVAI